KKTTDKASVERLVRERYGAKQEWLIHFIAGTGRAFLLNDSYQKETSTALGQLILGDDPTSLSIKNGNLPEEIGALLSTSIQALAQKSAGRQRDALVAVGQSLRQPIP